MITLRDLHELYERYGAGAERASAPELMGTINLSRDSTYRESVAVDLVAAVRLARVQRAEGASYVDLGAESSNARAARVPASEQAGILAPVVREIAVDGAVSVETYHPSVAEAALRAGARLINMTGRQHEDEILTLAAQYDASVVLCFGGEANVREDATAPASADPLQTLLEHFGPRVERARQLGLTRLIVDPGIGFHYDNLPTWRERVDFQSRVLLQTFRLQELGMPTLNVLPHTFDIFGDQFRKAEGFFAVLAILGGTDILRVHEVAHVRAVAAALQIIDLSDEPTGVRDGA